MTAIVIARSVSDEAIQKPHCSLDCFASLAMTAPIGRHCEARSDEAIQKPRRRLDCFAALAMTASSLRGAKRRSNPEAANLSEIVRILATV
jgi:hypothetical protein